MVKSDVGEKGATRRGGRRKGSPNKVVPEVKAFNVDTIVKIAERFHLDPTLKTPLEFMLELMNNETVENHHRLDAAKSAAPYIHQKLPTKIIQTINTEATENLDRKIEELLLKTT